MAAHGMESGTTGGGKRGEAVRFALRMQAAEEGMR
jgi:hypothetical protein